MNEWNAQKVKRIPVHEQVFNSLKEAISNGVWKVGEKIPTEMELSKMYGVNRLTVRMALQRLSGMGVLESRIGDGTYVKKFDFSDYIKQTKEFYLTQQLLDQIVEFRESLEVSALRFAVDRASEEEMQELQKVCTRMEEAREAYIEGQDPAKLDDFLDADITYHRIICKMSHNDLFVYAYDMARPALYEYMKRLIGERSRSWIRKAKAQESGTDIHRRVCNALQERDIHKCLKEYENIIDYQVLF